MLLSCFAAKHLDMSRLVNKGAQGGLSSPLGFFFGEMLAKCLPNAYNMPPSAFYVGLGFPPRPQASRPGKLEWPGVSFRARASCVALSSFPSLSGRQACWALRASYIGCFSCPAEPSARECPEIAPPEKREKEPHAASVGLGADLAVVAASPVG